MRKVYFLKLVMNGHPLFKDDFTFSLVNDSRIKMDQSNQLTNLNGRLWVNNLITLIGKNATGKTITMELLSGILLLIFYNRLIDETSLPLSGEKISFDVYLYGSDKRIYLDQLTLVLNKQSQMWYVASEKIYQKKAYAAFAKKDYFDFANDSKVKLLYDRRHLTPKLAANLAVDESIFKMVITDYDYQVPYIIDQWDPTWFTDMPQSLLELLDPSIEYLKPNYRDDQCTYCLKFKNSLYEIKTDSISEYVSEGTLRGIILYSSIQRALQTGNLLFVDDLEEHLAHSVMKLFIECFTDPKINKNRATLICSTHYSELLNDLSRGDEIYIVKRDPLIELQRYSQANIRQDLNRTEVYNADLIGGTAPKYKSYMNLKKAIKKCYNSIS